MKRFAQFFTLFMVAVLSAHAVPAVLNYAGQVAVNGQPFDGQGLFKFALVNADGNTTYWSNDGTSTNGSEPAAHVSISVNGGLYSLLLGNTAMSGMGAIDPQLFAQHTDAKLRVWFSDGVNGFQKLSPDRPFASVPYAFSAGTAQTAGSANIANGSVNLDMLSQDVKSQINAPIGLNRLSSEVTAKLDQNGSEGVGIAVGSIISFPSGQASPAGYSLYQQGTPKELVWEEKAPVSVARYAFDGVEVLGGKIYFVGGYDGTDKNTAERYDPTTNTWESLTSMTIAREGLASAVLNGKLYAIGGHGLSSVEIYDTSTESWTLGIDLPSELAWGTATSVNNKIYLIGGQNASNQDINQVLCFDPSTNQWSTKATMPTARHGHKLVCFENRIWAIGGTVGSPTNKVESYDPTTNSWQNEASITTERQWPFAWVANGKIYIGGSYNPYRSSIEVYNPMSSLWNLRGNLPLNIGVADSVVLNDKVYVVAGNNGSAYSNKVFAADMNASVAGVYDLYRKEGNASAGTPLVQAEVADGSVTASKMANNTITTTQLNEQILKYLKPEITAQPQPQTVYADSNVSYSVSAEGKYLTYQWKKDGSNLSGETNSTLTITDINATQHDGNYSVVVSNDFGSVESGLVELKTIIFPNTSNMLLWLDASEESTVIHNSKFVEMWVDKSGNNNNASQANSQNKPRTSISSISNLNSIDFDGNSDFMNISIFSGTLSAFLVLKVDVASGNRRILSQGAHSGATGNGFYFRVENGKFRALDIMTSGNSIINNMVLLVSLDCSSKLYVNGEFIGSENTVDITAPEIMNISSYNNGTAEFFDGSIGEMIFLQTTFDAHIRQKYEGYLAHKWGLTANLPSDHPYKNIAP